MPEDPAFTEAIRHHQAGRLAQAERLYRQVLARDPAHAPALLHLGLIAQAAGRLQEACELLQEAVRCSPGDPVCHNNLANVLRGLQRAPEAVEAYRAAVRCDPNYVNAHFNLASLLSETGDPRGAADAYRQVLRRVPDDADAMGGLGLALMETDSFTEAMAHLRRVVDLRPDDPVAHYNLATALKDQHERDAALALYRRALELDPDYAEAHNNLGLLLKNSGEIQEAKRAFSQAIRANPRHIHAHLHLSGLLLETGDHAGAEAIARTAVGLDARHPRALHGLGVVLVAMERHDEAEQALRMALDMDPELADARITLADSLHKQERISEAVMELLAVQAYSACYCIAQNSLGICRFEQGRASDGLVAFSRALDADPGYVAAHSNLLFCSNYRADWSASESFAAHRKWQRQHAGALAGAAPAVDLGPARRLHIGYVSPDLRNHSVANFIAPLIRDLDRNRFTVTCYSDVAREDNVTRQLREWADGWRELRGLDDDHAAAVVRRDAVDILVDLAGHTARNRLPVFARRVAPVQVTYLGYPNTTGLEQMDYRFTDAIADPPGEADTLHSEALVRLPGGFLCYTPLIDAPPVSVPPALTRGHVTFGSFNNAMKVNEQVVAAWARILNGLAGSKLIMKSYQLGDPDLQGHFHRLFAGHGIGAERIEMTGMLPERDEHLHAYARVDVALDPFPYNGTTTTCEALWMGVPVVALAGDVHRARVSASLLHHAGLDELVVPSIDAYVDKALELARDPRRLASLRGELRGRVAGSALCDAARAVDAVQSAFLDMWQRHGAAATSASAPAVDEDSEVRLNIGGTAARPGWKILNAVPGPGVDYVGRCADLSRFADDSIDEIYACHSLEQLGYREELPAALGHFHRVLKPGGTLRISVPDLAILCRLYLDPDLGAAARRHIMRMIYGDQTDAEHIHRCGFDWGSIQDDLQAAGFRDVARVQEFGVFDDASALRIEGRLVSINVEARKQG